MSKINSKLVVAITTGGTGGHVFPALAICEALIDNRNVPLLIHDERANPYVKLFNNPDIKKLVISSNSLSGNFYRKYIGILKLITNIFTIGRFLKTNQVTHILGVGGYVSFPGLLAAKLMGIKIYLHEPDAVLGRVNKLFAGSAKIIFTSFPDTIGLNKKYLVKTRWVGNPIRSEIFNINSNAKINNDKFTIAIIGGSQGAKILSEIPPLAIAQLPVNLQKKIVIYQQSRAELTDYTKTLYQKTKAQFEVKPFYDNIFEILKSADLVICRAGSSTISEITVLQKLAILVPFAAAKSNHQYYNAMYLVKNNAACMLEERDCSAFNLADILKKFILNPNKHSEITGNLKKLAKPNSARLITQSLIKSPR